ncbi:MAG: hypothetical protein COB67_08310 [SAR324 cluster bacterium]|uniref:Uncharacterized protein n=1 Tax=SAR324 cluster bacterium TaxID=2024889 RepID=A0A2A4T2A7_9DELT|nr:MAG: hypothetical protein COB67_08310 [SAR324 cluster bacterium]
MHQYMETVRNEIEAAAGQEAYLASSLFMRISQSLDYEDEGARVLENKESYEAIQHQAMNSINTQSEFNLDKEILAWQAAILRDISREFYTWWVNHKEQKFMAEDCFQDGESCIRIEASCEKLGLNPTEVFTSLLEVEYLLTRLTTSCNKVMLEVERYWKFKQVNEHKAPDNPFMNKRIALESQGTVLAEGIALLEDISQRCQENAKALAGAHHLLWIQAHQMLQSLIHALNGFLHYDYQQDAELQLNNWVDYLFTKTLENGEPNPTYHGPLHHRVIANLAQATQCLVQHTIRHNDAFTQRDNIMRPFISQTLEKVKRMELTNLKMSQEAQRHQLSLV